MEKNTNADVRETKKATQNGTVSMAGNRAQKQAMASVLWQNTSI